ncbi:M48 family metallopeptidase [Undibacterium sp. Ren11W]|uniref:M48 family metallopeptidase n=1 Tax=Undibacterium sp. Ren11W TaxID=3413045 RepID=UPI003BF3BBC0
MTAVAAHYFDGKTSRLMHVLLTVQDGVAHLQENGAAEAGAGGHNGVAEGWRRACPLAQLRLSERSNSAPRKVTFPDGAYLEISDHAAFNRLLEQLGFQDSWVVRMQQSWHGSLLALGATIALLLLIYFYGLPVASRTLAMNLPVSVERSLGDGILEYLDKDAFQKSELSPAQQQAILSRFQNLQAPSPDSPAFHLQFRKSKIGPNAFALPSGDIILTDELVALMADEDAVMGVLAHELGHLHERHLSRRIIQSSAIAAGVTLLFGDVSAVIANIPTLLLDLKYSRDAETEADDYALRMLDKNGIAREHMAHAFEKLNQLDPGITPYLSSHPSGADRIMRIRGQAAPRSSD